MIDINLIEILESKLPFWNDLTNTDQNLIIENTFFNKFKKGSFVYGSIKGCTGFLYVSEGILRGYIISDDGRDITLGRVNEGEICILTASCIALDSPLDFYLEAEMDSELLNVDLSIIENLAKKYPQIETFIYKISSKRFGHAFNKMKSIIFSPVEDRISDYLLEESEFQKSDTIKTTHDLIAKDIGSVREVVSRTLKLFEEEGIIRLQRGKIEIIEKSKLNKLEY